MRFSPMAAAKWQFSDEREKTIPVGNPGQREDNLGTCAYSEPRETAVASFEDGLAAITHRSIGEGHAYAFGVDLGAYFLKGYNNREEGLARSYVNGFEPADRCVPADAAGNLPEKANLTPSPWARSRSESPWHC